MASIIKADRPALQLSHRPSRGCFSDVERQRGSGQAPAQACASVGWACQPPPNWGAVAALTNTTQSAAVPIACSTGAAGSSYALAAPPPTPAPLPPNRILVLLSQSSRAPTIQPANARHNFTCSCSPWPSAAFPNQSASPALVSLTTDPFNSPR